MNLEKFILSIVKNVGLSREDVLTMVHKKKNELKGIISEELALFIAIIELIVEFNI